MHNNFTKIVIDFNSNFMHMPCFFGICPNLY